MAKSTVQMKKGSCIISAPPSMVAAYKKEGFETVVAKKTTSAANKKA